MRLQQCLRESPRCKDQRLVCVLLSGEDECNLTQWRTDVVRMNLPWTWVTIAAGWWAKVLFQIARPLLCFEQLCSMTCLDMIHQLGWAGVCNTTQLTFQCEGCTDRRCEQVVPELANTQSLKESRVIRLGYLSKTWVKAGTAFIVDVCSKSCERGRFPLTMSASRGAIDTIPRDQKNVA